MLLRFCDVTSGTELAYGATHCDAMFCTDTAHGGGRARTERAGCYAYLPTRYEAIRLCSEIAYRAMGCAASELAVKMFGGGKRTKVPYCHSVCSVLSGTDLAYVATPCAEDEEAATWMSSELFAAYADMRCPTLPQRMMLRVVRYVPSVCCYLSFAMCGTEIAYACFAGGILEVPPSEVESYLAPLHESSL
eukprot:3189783-Rhodomonas_salina.1